jgi:VWFA-related protein
LARDALAEFFNDSRPDDDYFVVTFSDSPELVADVTQSIGTLRARLGQVTPKGHTALLDAIYLGVQKLKHARYQRKALLIISDGGDNHSRFTAGEIKDMVMESDVQIYGIGIYSSIFHTPEEWSGQHLLTTITEATGGRTITVGNARELPQAAATISTDLRNEYVLGYASGRGFRYLSEGQFCIFQSFVGVGDGNRTHNVRSHSPVLCQLSYSHRKLLLYSLVFVSEKTDPSKAPESES